MSAEYRLGVDLGTTFSAGAVLRDGQRAPEMVRVDGDPMVPSVVFLTSDGDELVGSVATARAWDDPTRTAREFKRRFGDPVPILVGGTSYSAQRLTARVLSHIVTAATVTEGRPPASVTLTHPAIWGPYKTDLFEQVPDLAGLAGVPVRYLPEPEAAAVAYASERPVEAGDRIAVYDLGGGTFDAAVVERSAGGGFEILGTPQGIEQLGGIDFDEVVLHHVQTTLAERFEGLDRTDPGVVQGFAHLRDDCCRAKELLSADTATTIRVNLPALLDQVRLTRTEFEALVRPTIDQTIATLDLALSSAGLAAGDLSAVLLVGGSSRIPLIADMLDDHLGRPVVLDAHPKYATAQGAALPRPGDGAGTGAGDRAAAPGERARTGGGEVPGAAAGGAAVASSAGDGATEGRATGPGAEDGGSPETDVDHAEARPAEGEAGDEPTDRAGAENGGSVQGAESGHAEAAADAHRTTAADGATDTVPGPGGDVTGPGGPRGGNRADGAEVVPPSPPPTGKRPRRRRALVAAGGVLGLLAVLAAGLSLFGGDGSDGEGTPLTSSAGEITPCRTGSGPWACITGVTLDGDDFVVGFETDLTLDDGSDTGTAATEPGAGEPLVLVLVPPQDPVAELDPGTATGGWSGTGWYERSPAVMTGKASGGGHGVPAARELGATEVCLSTSGADGTRAAGVGNCANITGLLDGTLDVVGDAPTDAVTGTTAAIGLDPPIGPCCSTEDHLQLLDLDGRVVVAYADWQGDSELQTFGAGSLEPGPVANGDWLVLATAGGDLYGYDRGQTSGSVGLVDPDDGSFDGLADLSDLGYIGIPEPGEVDLSVLDGRALLIEGFDVVDIDLDRGNSATVVAGDSTGDMRLFREGDDRWLLTPDAQYRPLTSQAGDPLGPGSDCPTDEAEDERCLVAAADGDGLWVVDEDGGTIIHLVPDGSTDRGADLGIDVSAMTFGAGSLWVAGVDGDRNVVIQVDPASGEPIGRARTEHEGDAVVATDEAVFTVDLGESALTRLEHDDFAS